MSNLVWSTTNCLADLKVSYYSWSLLTLYLFPVKSISILTKLIQFFQECAWRIWGQDQDIWLRRNGFKFSMISECAGVCTAYDTHIDWHPKSLNGSNENILGLFLLILLIYFAAGVESTYQWSKSQSSMPASSWNVGVWNTFKASLILNQKQPLVDFWKLVIYF